MLCYRPVWVSCLFTNLSLNVKSPCMICSWTLSFGDKETKSSHKLMLYETEIARDKRNLSSKFSCENEFTEGIIQQLAIVKM